MLGCLSINLSEFVGNHLEKNVKTKQAKLLNDILFDITYILSCIAQDLPGEAKTELMVLIEKISNTPELKVLIDSQLISSLTDGIDTLRNPSVGYFKYSKPSSDLWTLYRSIHESLNELISTIS